MKPTVKQNDHYCSSYLALFNIWYATFKMMLYFTCSYKVAVERMGIKSVADRFGSSYKGLSDYLTPKQALSPGHPVVSPSMEKKIEKQLKYMQCNLTR